MELCTINLWSRHKILFLNGLDEINFIILETWRMNNQIYQLLEFEAINLSIKLFTESKCPRKLLLKIHFLEKFPQ